MYPINRTSPLLTLALAGAGAMYAVHALARHTRRMDLRDKVVLLTGGSRGLGLVMSRRLLARGARLVICGRDQDTLQRALAELIKISHNVMAIPTDVTDRRAVDLLMRAVHEQFGPVDVLINNVSQLVVGPSQALVEAEYQRAMDSTFWAAYRLIEAVLPDMRASGGGRIANISSVGGLVPMPHMASYVAAKHALTGYSRVMHNELRRENIIVTTVNPGLMRTGSPRNVDVKGQAELEYAWFKLGDSLPPLAMSANRAAEKIINAIEHGDAELTLTLAAKLGGRVQAMAPNFSAWFGDIVNRLLPKPIGSKTSFRGHESESAITKSRLTMLTERAAARNNELDVK